MQRPKTCHSRTFRRTLFPALLSLLAVVGCSAPPETDVPNLIVICIDVLRADHLGAYEYERETSPAVDRLARKGVVFTTASSTASWTKPSVPSYLTGRFPHQLGVYQGARELDGKLVSDMLRPEEQTLAELFAAAGHQTVAFVANPTVGGDFGLSQGFDAYTEGDASAGEIRESFFRWMDGANSDQPFFAYLHFNDVHLPYDPPGKYRTIFGDIPSKHDFSTASWKVVKRRIRDGQLTLSADDRQAMIDLYDGEIRYVDSQIELLLAELESRGALDNTMIVVLSDHGEELLDRGGIDHGSSLHAELLGVPLIMRFPGGEPGGARITDPVSLVDLVPTLLDQFGIEAPVGLAGSSLVDLAWGDGSGELRPVYAEGMSSGRGYQQSLRLGQWKYIVSVPIRREGARSLDLRKVLRQVLRVEVEGIAENIVVMIGDDVEIKGDQDDRRDEVTGPIEALDLDAGELVVFGYQVRLSERIKIRDPEDQDIDGSALELGQFVKIYGNAVSATEFDAEKIKQRDPDRSRKYKLEGPIQSAVKKAGGEHVFLLVGREVRVDGAADVEREGDTQVAGQARTGDPWTVALAQGGQLTEELYDLNADPTETENIAATHADKTREMRSALAALRADTAAEVAPTQEIDQLYLEKLRALGYVE
jgi:arylsulfatase A-like enzyme